MTISSALDASTTLSEVSTNHWDHLHNLFRLIENGDAAIGVPEYNGGLFDDSQCPPMAKFVIGDDIVARVVDALARSGRIGESGRQMIDYSELGVREIGWIYEGLLQHLPRVATESMAVVRSAGKETIVPTSDVAGQTVVATYEPGDVYLTLHNGERRATGSYYTPEPIVRFIVRTTIDKLLAGVAADQLPSAILELKILDPAMGSGHFLVDSVDYLASRLVGALGGNDTNSEDEVRWARREIVERCFYGVDKNPIAVELAKLSLWLHTASLDRPLNYLDHHFKCGNSLRFCRQTELGQLPAVSGRTSRAAMSGTTLAGFQLQSSIAEAVQKRFELMAGSSDTILDVKQKKDFDVQARDAIRRVIDAHDLWLSSQFGNEINQGEFDLALIALSDGSELDNPDLLTTARQIAQDNQFFHWQLEFPEVFFDGDGDLDTLGGFDAVVGNPPYVIEARGNAELFKELKKTPVVAEWYEKNIDLFCFFSQLALELTKAGGIHSFIIPSYWKNRSGAAKMRTALFKKCILVTHVDFGPVPMFVDALGHHSSIYLWRMTGDVDQPQVEAARVPLAGDGSVTQRRDRIFFALDSMGYDLVSVVMSLGKVIFTSPAAPDVLSKILGIESPVYLDAVRIVRGVDTAPSTVDRVGVFVLTDDEKQKLLENATEAELSVVKPMWEANQLRSYGVIEPNAKWLLYTDQTTREAMEETPEQYPALVDHLDGFISRITSSNKPYGLHRPKALSVFEDPEKIVFARKTPRPRFALVPHQMFAENGVYFIAGGQPLPQEVLLTIFNSTLFTWWCYVHKHQGDQLQIDKEIIVDFPLPSPETIINISANAIEFSGAQVSDLAGGETSLGSRVLSFVDEHRTHDLLQLSIGIAKLIQSITKEQHATRQELSQWLQTEFQSMSTNQSENLCVLADGKDPNWSDFRVRLIDISESLSEPLDYGRELRVKSAFEEVSARLSALFIEKIWSLDIAEQTVNSIYDIDHESSKYVSIITANLTTK